jgi:hypothetical protein
VSSGTSFSAAWKSCFSLTTFPANMFDTCTSAAFGEAWRNCALDQTSVDNILVSLDASGVLNGTVNIDNVIDSFGDIGTNSAPGVAGLAAKASLEAKGWTVAVNPPPCDLPPYGCNTSVNPYCVTNFTQAWSDCDDLTSFPLLDVSNGTNFSGAWSSCNGLTSFSELNVSSGTIFTQAWFNCNGLTSFPLLDVSNGTNFGGAWNSCSGLTSFPLLDVSSGTNFGGTWFNCTNLTSFPLLDVSSGTIFTQSWGGCTSLTSFPALDFSSGTNFEYTWQNCTDLTTFPAGMFDSCLATNFTDAWLNCALDQTSVDNILVSLDTAGQSNGIVTINGGTSAAPSATGLAAKASLEAKGWNVQTVSPPTPSPSTLFQPWFEPIEDWEFSI